MIFLQRFTVPDVSMTAYVGFDEAYETNAGLSMGMNLTLTRRYVAPRFLIYWAKLCHNYKSDPKCSYKIYIILQVTCFFCFWGA